MGEAAIQSARPPELAFDEGFFRDPHTKQDLLSYQLVGGAVSAEHSDLDKG